MAKRSFKLRLHILGSKLHKWLAIFVGLATFSATKFVFGAALRLGIFQVIRGGRAPHHFHHRY